MAKQTESDFRSASRGNPNRARDHLANERTFLAWVRTGVAIVVFGFAIGRFAIAIGEFMRTQGHASQTPGLSVWLGTIAIISGVLPTLVAYFATTEPVTIWKPGDSNRLGSSSI